MWGVVAAGGSGGPVEGVTGDDVDEDEGGDGRGAGLDRGECSGAVAGPGRADGFRFACQSDRRGERVAAVAAGAGYPVGVEEHGGARLEDRLQGGGVCSVESVVGDPGVQPQHGGGEFAQVGGDVGGGERCPPLQYRVESVLRASTKAPAWAGWAPRKVIILFAVAFGVVEGAAVEAVAVAGQRLGGHGGAIALWLQGGRGLSVGRRRRGRGGHERVRPGVGGPGKHQLPAGRLG